jgi:hypothetical protein
MRHDKPVRTAQRNSASSAGKTAIQHLARAKRQYVLSLYGQQRSARPPQPPCDLREAARCNRDETTEREREKVRKLVRVEIERRFGVYVAPGERVVTYTLPGPMGQDSGFALARSAEHLEQACQECYDCHSIEFRLGLVVGMFCAQCRITIAIRNYRCEGNSAGCTKSLWVNELGLPSALCKACDDAGRLCASRLTRPQDKPR